MGTIEVVVKCEICGESGEDLSLYSANHKDLGWISVCNACWVKLYEENEMVAGSGSCGNSSVSPCSSCSGSCCF